MVEKLTRRGVLLDLVFTKKEGLVGDVMTRESLGCIYNRLFILLLLRSDLCHGVHPHHSYSKTTCTLLV